MKNVLILCILLLCGGMFSSCKSKDAPPQPYRQMLTPGQLAWQKFEFEQSADEYLAANFARGAKISATDTRGDSNLYSPENILDGNYDSYWATNDRVKRATIELEMTEQQTFNRILIQEYPPLGQRIAAFNISYLNEETNEWKALTEGTTIGHKRILSTPLTTARKIRLQINESLVCPAINYLSIYYTPDISTSNK